MTGSEHWTAAEYREFVQTGREPVRGRTDARQAGNVGDSPSVQASPERKGQSPCSHAGTGRDSPLVPGRSAGGFSGGGGETDGDKPKKQRKYRNHPTTEDGYKFDSLHEAKVYRDLKTRVRAGELKCIVRQVGFDLPGGIRYFADFVAIRTDNTIEVIDAKSEITRKNQVYINKKKQMRSCWGIEIEEL